MARLQTRPVQMVCRLTRMAGQRAMKNTAHNHSVLQLLVVELPVSTFSLSAAASSTGASFLPPSSSSENSSRPTERRASVDCLVADFVAIVEALVEALDDRLADMNGNEFTSAAARS